MYRLDVIINNDRSRRGLPSKIQFHLDITNKEHSALQNGECPFCPPDNDCSSCRLVTSGFLDKCYLCHVCFSPTACLDALDKLSATMTFNIGEQRKAIAERFKEVRCRVDWK